MLNNYKIGKKLTAGFLLILGLLIVVAGVGYYALITSRKATEDMLRTENLYSNVLRFQNLLTTAQLHSANASLFRDVTYENRRKGVDEEIDKIKTQIADQFEGENKTTHFPNLVKKYENFKADDTRWFEIERTRANNQTEMNKAAENALKSVQGMQVVFNDAMRSPNEAVKTEDATGFADFRVDRLLKAEQILVYVQTARYYYFVYMATTIPERQIRAQEGVQTTLDSLQRTLNDFKSEVDEDRKSTVEDVQKQVEAWKKYLEANLDCIQQQEVIDAAHDRDSKDMEETIGRLMGNLETRVAGIREQSEATDARLISFMIAAAVIAVIIGLVLSMTLSSNITTGISTSVKAMKTIADEGDVAFTVPASAKERKDEVGDLAKALDSILHQFQNVEGLANNLANSNWNISTKVRGDKDTMNINLNTMLTQVNEALYEINESVTQVTTGAGEVSSASQTLSSGAQESAASLEEITASMNEISSQTKQNAEGATQARDLAEKATKAAVEGQGAMQEMTGAMERITQNSGEIQRVIKVIDDIAFQTNLLALNAAVEAARAGVHGKGFAVVAEEVRNLAARSAKAAQETTELISKSGKEIGNGGEVALRTSEVLNTIADQIKQTTDLIGGIAIASNEQAQGVAQITIGLQQIDQVTQQNTAAAEECASAANEMSSMASNLQKLVAKFQLRR